MTDNEWIAAAKAKFDYPDPILPVWYTAEAWVRHNQHRINMNGRMVTSTERRRRLH